jgi:hypothetical protein
VASNKIRRDFWLKFWLEILVGILFDIKGQSGSVIEKVRALRIYHLLTLTFPSASRLSRNPELLLMSRLSRSHPLMLLAVNRML